MIDTTALIPHLGNPLREIGQHFGVTGERIRQLIQARSLTKQRKEAREITRRYRQQFRNLDRMHPLTRRFLDRSISEGPHYACRLTTAGALFIEGIPVVVHVSETPFRPDYKVPYLRFSVSRPGALHVLTMHTGAYVFILPSQLLGKPRWWYIREDAQPTITEWPSAQALRLERAALP